MQRSSSETSGVSGIFILGLVFLVLKLCNVITWSWWWVLLPFYVIPAIALLAFMLFAIFTLTRGGK